jgi:hypothetical protein
MIATMALTWFQRLKVAFRGWSRRRDEANDAFLRKNTGWAPQPGATAAKTAADGRGASSGTVKKIDLEGLQVAYLDDSGQISYYLDTVSGDVVEARDAPTRADMEISGRFKRVPARSEESDTADRRAFIASLEESQLKESLSATANPQDFRKALAADRGAERAWYNFKNQRATTAIASWLHSLGLG